MKYELIAKDSTGMQEGGTFKALSSDQHADIPKNVFDRIGQLSVDKQIQVVGAGLLAFTREYQHQQAERSIGAAIGIGEGVGSLANDAVELVKGLGAVLQFGQDVVSNNPRAKKRLEKLAKSLVRLLLAELISFRCLTIIFTI